MDTTKSETGAWCDGLIALKSKEELQQRFTKAVEQAAKTMWGDVEELKKLKEPKGEAADGQARDGSEWSENKFAPQIKMEAIQSYHKGLEGRIGHPNPNVLQVRSQPLDDVAALARALLPAPCDTSEPQQRSGAGCGRHRARDPDSDASASVVQEMLREHSSMAQFQVFNYRLVVPPPADSRCRPSDARRWFLTWCGGVAIGVVDAARLTTT